MPSCSLYPSRCLRVLVATILLPLVCYLAPPPPHASAVALLQAGGPGQQTFQAKCTGCHTIGQGKLVGPDLQGVTTRRDPAWIKSFITDPGKMFAANDPVAQQLLEQNNGIRMPALGLSAAEVDGLLAYLQITTATQPGGGTGAGSTQAAAGGNRAAGSQMFIGQMALAGGAPACIACHTVAGTGSLGGGALGPDLTHVAQRYGAAGLAAALRTIAFPTMAGPFNGRPLNATEQADLVAFFVQADQEQQVVPPATPGAITGNTQVVLGIGLAGLVALFALLAFFWPRQRQSIAVRLRRSSRLPKT